MRIRVSHQTIYDYTPPAKSLIQTLRLTPRNHEGQYVVNWRIDVDADAESRLKAGEDAFANITHSLTVSGPIETLTVTVEGVVETHDTMGILRGTVERFPPGLYLRETGLTLPDDAIRAMADDVRAVGGGESLPVLHELMTGVHELMTFDDMPTSPEATAADALARGRGGCQDFSHVFIAAARHLMIPARYVSGYLWRDDGVVDQNTGHGWVEAYVDGLGWVAFDPTNDICPTIGHVRVAIGLDSVAAAPVRGSRYGFGEESQDVKVRVMAQNQSQS